MQLSVGSYHLRGLLTSAQVHRPSRHLLYQLCTALVLSAVQGAIYPKASVLVFSPRLPNKSSILVVSPRLLPSSSLLVFSPRLLPSCSLLVFSPRLLCSSSLLVFSPRILLFSPRLLFSSSLLVFCLLSSSSLLVRGRCGNLSLPITASPLTVLPRRFELLLLFVSGRRRLVSSQPGRCPTTPLDSNSLTSSLRIAFLSLTPVVSAAFSFQIVSPV